jgi:hypothetical protein
MAEASEPPELAISDPNPSPSTDDAAEPPTPADPPPVSDELTREEEEAAFEVVDEAPEPPADPIDRIAPIPTSAPRPAAEPEPEPVRPRTPPPAPKTGNGLTIAIGVVALLLGVAFAWWWLSNRPPATDDLAAAPVPADTAAAFTPVPDTLAQAAVPEEPETNLRGATPVTVPPGFTVVVGGAPTSAEAEAIAEPYRAAGFRTGILLGQSRGQRYYRVGVGQFESREQAVAALASDDFPDQAPADAFIFPF